MSGTGPYIPVAQWRALVARRSAVRCLAYEITCVNRVTNMREDVQRVQGAYILLGSRFRGSGTRLLRAEGRG